jgi:hypothetical protein
MRLQSIGVALLFIFLAAGMVQNVFAVSFTPPLSSLPPGSQGKAVVLSSLDALYPMGQYDADITYYLNEAGFQVTTLTNRQISIDFLLTQLNNYSVIIWRTNTYYWKHIEYWYVGEVANSATELKYASDFANGWINANAGILGVSLGFFKYHFTAQMLSNVRLMMLMASDSLFLSGFMLNAGVDAVIFSLGQISLSFGLIDDLTTELVAYLLMGENVSTAVYNVVSPYVQNSNPEDPSDSSYSPPFWYQGDGALTL